MNGQVIPFEMDITTLNKAYNSIKQQGQEFTKKSKVEQRAKRIKNPTKDVQIMVTVELMHASNIDYNGGAQYLTNCLAQINTTAMVAPGNNLR